MPKLQGVGIGMITDKMLREAEERRKLVLISQGKLNHEHTLQNSGVLPDWAIREFITIDGWVDYDECPQGAVSYGLTSAGYDIRVGQHFKVFTNARCETVSPRNLKPECFMSFDLTGHEWTLTNGVVLTADNAGIPQPCEVFTKCLTCGVTSNNPKARFKCTSPKAGTPDTIKIPPNSFALAETVEVLYIPRNVVCWCIGKSTYARCGINMNFTPFEPGWWGVVTVEIINATPLPVEIIAGQGIGQAEFFLMAGEPERSYGDKKNAKYQGQTGLTLPTVK